MRIVKDGLGDVFKDGVKIHTRVRIMQDDQKRVAVFADKNRNPPIAVYGPDEVTFNKSGGCSTCQGWPAQVSMKQVWIQYERQAANV